MNNSVHFQVSNVNFQKNPCKFKKPFTKLQLMQHYQNQRNRFYDGKITENEFWNKALVIMSKICKAKSNQKTPGILSKICKAKSNQKTLKNIM